MTRRYERRRPQKTPLHKIVSENLESWLAWREAAERPVPGYVEEELRGYLACGLLCFGFARAVCMTCRTGFVVAFSCKGRGVCPSSNGRHMARDRRASCRSLHPAGARAAVGDLRPQAPARHACGPARRRGAGRIAGVRYVLPRHKAATWVGPGRGRTSTRPEANGVVELTPIEFLDRLADLVPPPRKHRHRYHGVFAPNHKLRAAVTALAKRQRRQAARRRCRRACGQYACRGRLLRREPRDAQATLARHVTDCLGETDSAGGGVSARVPRTAAATSG